MRVRRRLRPFRLLPWRMLVIGVLVTACVAAGRISSGPTTTGHLTARQPAVVAVADVIQPSWLRALPVRRNGAAVSIAVQLVSQLPRPAALLTKPHAATVPVAGKTVAFQWRWQHRAHRRLVTTGRSGWAQLRLANVNRRLVVHVAFPGGGSYAAATDTAVSVPPRPVTRSYVRASLVQQATTHTPVPRAIRHFLASAFVFPFLHPGQAQPPGSWSQDQGVDMFAVGDACGSAAVLVAVGNGVVIQEGISGFGPTAPVIRMTSGPLAGRNVYYGHTGRVYVPVGATVRAGQPIAEIGCGQVGYSAGPHLEIGVGVRGGPPCCPGWGQTSGEMYRLLAATY